MTNSPNIDLVASRLAAAEACWNMFPFSLAVAETDGWVTAHDEVRRRVAFGAADLPEPVHVDFVCIFARETSTILACGLDPAEGKAHAGLEPDLLPTVLRSMQTVRDLADLGRLNPDDRLISGDGESLWHEAKRQEDALEILDDLIGAYGSTLDKFASLPVIAQRLGADGLPEADIDDVRSVAPGFPLGAAVATCIELACQQLGDAQDTPQTRRFRRDNEAIDVASAFWIVCGDEVCKLTDLTAEQASPMPASPVPD